MNQIPDDLFRHHWPGHDFDRGSTQDLGNNGGFSGARLWSVQASHGQWLLRCWPRHQDESRVQWIHRHIQSISERLKAAGSTVRLAVPIPTRTGATYAKHQGNLFHIEPWIHGESRAVPSDDELKLAMKSLAEFHRASTKISCESTQPPAIELRLRRLAQLRSIEVDHVQRSVADSPSQFKSGLQSLAIQVCRSFHRLAEIVQLELLANQNETAEVIPCLRDIWHAHVLFRNDSVGFIDYGAMSLDFWGADVSRLVGSFAQDSDERWELALQTYRESREDDINLARSEFKRIRAIDRANTVISPMNWITWIFLENREFHQHEKVAERIAEYAKRMQFLEDSTREIRY